MNTANSFHPVFATLLFGCLGFIVPGSLHAQGWQFVTGEYLGTAFNGTGTVLVVGEHGLIMRSSDKGETWELPTSNTYQTLRDVAFLNEQEALAVGDAGLLLRSEDGGATWNSTIPIDNDATLDNLTVRGNSIWMTSRDRLFRSSDAGRTWGTAVPLPDTALGMSMVTEAIGLMVSGDGTIYRTADSGKTWITSFTEPNTRFQAVDFSPNGRIGVAGGEKSRVYITRDSGTRWTLSNVQDTLLNITAVAVNDEGLITVGGGLHRWGDNLLYTSRDTGSTWEIVRFIHAEDQAAVLSVALGNEHSGIASTNFGAIIMTEDAWQTIDTITDIKNVSLGRLPYVLYNAAITANNTGIIPNNTAPGGYTATTDGGIIWKFRQYGIGSWHSARQAGSENLIMFGDLANSLYRTGNAGETWEWLGGEFNPNVFSDLASTQTLDARSVFQLRNTRDKSSGILYYSSDSGQTFSEESFSEVRQYYILDFITTDIGLIGGITYPDDPDSIMNGYGYSAIFLTKDRGRNRKLIYEYSGIENVTGWVTEMVDTNTILLATGGRAQGLPDKRVILKTTDQGENWEVSYTLDWQIYDMAAFNDSVWYGVGENATIVMTSDRGKTWTQEKIDPLPRFRFDVVPRFRQIFLLPDDQTGMIIGEGTILRKVFPQKLSGVTERETRSKKDQTLYTYPNPVKGEVIVLWSGDEKLNELAVFDVLGREVKTYKNSVRSGERIKIDLSGFVPGIYQVVGKGVNGATLTTASIVVE